MNSAAHTPTESDRRRLRRAPLAFLAGSFGAVFLLAVPRTPVLAQDQPSRPSFKVAIGLVQIDVSVLDDKRQPIRGLQASDFTVLEDGKPRPIRVFEAIDLPPRAPQVDAALAGDAGSSVATNQVGNEDGRLVFILMDRTIPLGQPVLAAKNIATAAINALGPSDLAAIVTTGGNVPQTLTADRGRLLRAVNQGDWSTIISPEQQEIVGKYDPFSDGRCLCGLCVLETVTNIADAARDAPRRNKLLLFIGSSIIVQAGPRPMAADPGCDSRVRDARRKMVDTLALSHLTVHSIDPSGLVTGMVQGSGNGRAGQDGPAVRRQQLLDDTISRLTDQGSLEVLPELTGGRAFANTNNPEQNVPEIFDESDAYYVLAFEPADPISKKNGRRSIEVKVARSGARVRTTKYALPPVSGATTASRRAGTPVPPIDLALAGLLPEARVPLELSLAAFASADGPKAYVSVSLDTAGFDESVTAAAPLDVAVAVLDQRGRRVATIRDAGAATRPAERRTHLVLPPGDYELRAAVHARGSDAAASVFSQLLIPSFADAPLSMSDLILGTRENATPPSDAATPVIPIVATTARTFRRGGTAWAFVEVYQATRKSDAPQAVQVRTTFVNGAGRTVHGESSTIDAAAFVGRRAGLRVRLPLDVLAPASYVLRVETTRGSRTAARAVAFVVE